MALDIRTGKVETPRSIRFADSGDDETKLTHLTASNEYVTIHSEDGEFDIPLEEDEARWLVKALEKALSDEWWG